MSFYNKFVGLKIESSNLLETIACFFGETRSSRIKNDVKMKYSKIRKSDSFPESCKQLFDMINLVIFDNFLPADSLCLVYVEHLEDELKSEYRLFEEKIICIGNKLEPIPFIEQIVFLFLYKLYSSTYFVKLSTDLVLFILNQLE